MTFVIVSRKADGETVIGTIWADGEQQANILASAVSERHPEESIVIRRGEIREIPLKLQN